MGIEKAVDHESNDNTDCNWCSWYSHQRISTRVGGFGNKRTSGDHPNYCNDEVGHDTVKSPENLKTLTVTQNPGKKPLANASVKNFQKSKIIMMESEGDGDTSCNWSTRNYPNRLGKGA